MDWRQRNQIVRAQLVRDSDVVIVLGNISYGSFLYPILTHTHTYIITDKFVYACRIKAIDWNLFFQYNFFMVIFKLIPQWGNFNN